MAQHDHINKKRPTKKAKVEKKPFPVIGLIIATTLIACLGYGLYYISAHSDEQPKPKAVKKAPPKEAVKTKPTVPTFIDEIANTELEVEVQKVEDKGPHRLQCASLRSEDDAYALKAKIAFKTGMIAQVDRTEGKNGVWYRVRVGPFNTKRLAESANNKIKRQRLQACAIRKMPKTN